SRHGGAVRVHLGRWPRPAGKDSARHRTDVSPHCPRRGGSYVISCRADHRRSPIAWRVVGELTCGDRCSRGILSNLSSLPRRSMAQQTTPTPSYTASSAKTAKTPFL